MHHLGSISGNQYTEDAVLGPESVDVLLLSVDNNPRSAGVRVEVHTCIDMGRLQDGVEEDEVGSEVCVSEHSKQALGAVLDVHHLSHFPAPTI